MARQKVEYNEEKASRLYKFICATLGKENCTKQECVNEGMPAGWYSTLFNEGGATAVKAEVICALTKSADNSQGFQLRFKVEDIMETGTLGKYIIKYKVMPFVKDGNPHCDAEGYYDFGGKKLKFPNTNNLVLYSSEYKTKTETEEETEEGTETETTEE